MQQQTILITGASGLLGLRVVPLLARALPDCRIIAVSRNKNCLPDDPRVKVIYGDLGNKDFWSKVPETITTAIHLAAFIPWRAEQKNDERVVSENVIPIEMLVSCSRLWPGLQQVIYSSSVSVYGPTSDWLNESSTIQPASLYGKAKLRGEELFGAMKGIRVATLRFTSLYAQGQYDGTVLPIMVKRAQQRQDLLIFGDGTRTQDFLHCEDAAYAVLLALQREADGVYNIGTGTPVTMTELAETVSSVFSDGESKIVYQPERADGDPGIKLDVSKARRELNYQPRISLECGLRKLKQEMESESE
jgi:UDP-glucose 4-epimerase